MLRFMGSQRVGQDWVTELNWPPSLDYFILYIFFYSYFSPHFSLHFPFWSTFLPCGFPNVLFFFFLTFTELLAMYRECFFFFTKKHFCSTEEKCRACYLLKGFLSISNDPKLSSYFPYLLNFVHQNSNIFLLWHTHYMSWLTWGKHSISFRYMLSF